jgi:MFS family permease
VSRAGRAAERLYTLPFAGVQAVDLLAFGQWFGLQPVIPLLVLSLGGDAAMTGIAFAFFSIPSVIFRPIFGRLVDRVGTRRILVVGTLAVGMVAPGYLVPSLLVLMGLRIAHGIAWAAVMTAAPALMARLAPLSRRGEAASVFDLMPSLAQMTMPAVGLLLYTTLGTPGVFAMATALGLAACLVVLASAPVDPPVARAAPSTGSLPILEPTATVPMLITMLFMSAAALFVVYPPILATEKGIPIAELAIYYPVYGLAIVGSRILMSRRVDQLPRLRVVAVGSAMAIVALLLSSQATTIVTLTAAGAINAAAVGVLVPTMTAAVIDHAPPGRIGSAMGTYTLGYQLAGGLGAAAWGFMIEHSGFVAAYLAAAGIQVVLLVLVRRFRGRLARVVPVPVEA